MEGPDSVKEQCSSNRTGILCGGCKPEHSLALGTSRCLPNCSNWYVFLLVPFALAGIVLVCLILFCNLTVSIGTINGLVYFANIVGFNSDIFFPKSTINVLLIFIAWINLDFSFETCFYKGMDMYGKTWLQFVFPFYVWFLVVIIIVSSHYSVLVSKLTRSNSVPVLATLLRLSYAKLLRTIIITFSFTSLQTSDGSSVKIWLYDGNVSFLHGRHIALFLFALLALLLLVLPYTALLLLSPYLQAWASHNRLRWVTRIKPFLDAYHGPYRDKFRNWTGVMLLIQIAQFFAFALNSLGDPKINLVIIIITSASLMAVTWNLGVIYRRRMINLLETFCLLSLCILACASLYVRQTTDMRWSHKQLMVTFTIVGIALVAFTMVIIYHTVIAVKSVCWTSKAALKWKPKFNNDIQLDTTRDSEENTEHRSPLSTSLREPLLDDQ